MDTSDAHTTWSYQHIPSTVYLITARYRRQDDEPYESFMISPLLRDDEFWLHIEYTRRAARHTLRLLQDSMARLESAHYLWPARVLPLDGAQVVTMARDAPRLLPTVVGYVHDVCPMAWPKGRAQYVYWENVRDSTSPMFG